MNPDELNTTLRRLAERLDRIERKLGLVQPGAAPAPPTAPPPTTPAPAQPPPARAAAPPVKPMIRPVARRPAPAARPIQRPRPAAKGPGLEQQIGQNWMAWVGAIVIVIGAAFLVKLGYDAGWWGSLSELTRCLLVAAFGGLLLAAGELALRRIGRAASVGLLGAGLGTLYLDAYAAFHWFTLISREWAFVLMAVVAILGFGITFRSAFVTIGVLSIVGGYLTPWLLAGGSTHIVEVGTYLTMLLGISLALSAVRPATFRPLRYVALGGHGLVGLGWVIEASSAGWLASLAFGSLWWGIVYVELLIAAMRGQSAVGNVLAGLLSTAWFVTVGTWVLAETQPPGFDWLGLFTLTVGAVAAAGALQFGPPVSELSGKPRTAMDRLAVAMWAQAGILLAIAIALQFDGYGRSIGWLAVALGSIEIGRRLDLRGVDVFGLIVGALALLRVATLDRELPVLQGQLLSVGMVSVTRWGLLGLAAVAAAHTAARRLGGKWTAGPVVLAALGTAGWMGLCGDQCSGLAVTGGWLAGCIALLAADRFGARQRYFQIALAVLVAAAARWLLVDAMAGRLSPDWDPAGRLPFLNWQMGLAAAIAGVGWWAAVKMARRSRQSAGAMPGSVWQVVVAAGAVLVLIGMSFELDRVVESLIGAGRTFAQAAGQVRQLLLTMLWALGAAGVGVLVRSMMHRGPAGRLSAAPRLLVRFAATVLALCAVKWLLADTAYWAIVGTGRTPTALPVANLQMLAGLVIAGSGLMLLVLTGTGKDGGASSPFWERPAAWVPVAAAVVILWGLSFEVDRAVSRFEDSRPADWTPLWNPLLVRCMWWTLLWSAGGLAMMLWTRLRFSMSMLAAGWVIAAASAAFWLTGGTLIWRGLGVVPARVLLNLQALAGAAAAAVLAASIWIWGRAPVAIDGPLGRRNVKAVSLLLIGLAGLWLGSLEIDRFLAPETGRLATHAGMARQTALSIYWGLYAIGLIALGFSRRSAPCRYGGLALLALTLGKVLTVDMSEVGYIYRVLSFLGVGLLLVLTSVGYSRLGRSGPASHKP